MAFFPGVFRFREAEYIEDFLSHILSEDEIRILHSLAYFPFSRRLLNHEKHTTILRDDWMNKHQIHMLSRVSQKKIYHKYGILRDLIADSFILEWRKNTWGGYKSYFQLNLDIPLLQSYARSFLDCFQIIDREPPKDDWKSIDCDSLRKRDSPIEEMEKVEKELVKHPVRTRQEIITDIFESQMRTIGLEPSKDDGYMTLFSRFLRERRVANDAIHDLIHSMKNEPVKNWNDLVVVTIESAGGSSTGFDWLPWYLNGRSECQDWLMKILQASKVPTEAINSILVGLRLNYGPAQKELREILSKQGVACDVINWLITKLSG
jgi:hypothetical protein